MDRINLILQHKKYKEYISRIEEYETEREFCRHDMTHFLDVCRLGEILYLQNRKEELTERMTQTVEGTDCVLPMTNPSARQDKTEHSARQDKTEPSEKQDGKEFSGRIDMTELIYAAGLLHDIGRFKEYETGLRHEEASSRLAPEILAECGFGEEETKEICLAIGNHRNSEMKDENSLSGFLYRADKMSRPCFACKAEAKCDWSIAKKNLKLTY